MESETTKMLLETTDLIRSHVKGQQALRLYECADLGDDLTKHGSDGKGVVKEEPQ